MKVLLVLVLLAVSTIAQSAQPDRWKGLIIGESSPEDAVRLLGAPESTKTDRLQIKGADANWLTKAITEKKFQILTFKKVQSVDRATLSFQDGRLAVIELDMAEQPAASALPRIYNISFAPRISGMTEALYPKDFERNQGRVYPKSYPTVYDLVAVTETTFVSALIANNSFGTILRKTAGATDTGDFPGKAILIRIISRSLENRDGADALSGSAPPSPDVRSPAKTCYEAGRKVPCPT